MFARNIIYVSIHESSDKEKIKKHTHADESKQLGKNKKQRERRDCIYFD